MTGAAQPDPLYYLRNFQQAIAWVVERNQDLLSAAEREFSAQLASLPVPAQALLTRLLMRQGVLFRTSKIRYPEIESIETAYRHLTELRWVDPAPALSLRDVFRLTTHAERLQRFGDAIRRMGVCTSASTDLHEALLQRLPSSHRSRGRVRPATS